MEIDIQGDTVTNAFCVIHEDTEIYSLYINTKDNYVYHDSVTSGGGELIFNFHNLEKDTTDTVTFTATNEYEKEVLKYNRFDQHDKWQYHILLVSWDKLKGVE